MAKKIAYCDRDDCAAYFDGICNALRNNDFGDRECPFFKTKEQNEKERKECAIRMIVGTNEKENEVC